MEPREQESLNSGGAEWIWNLADIHFPGAVQIVDLYHARQHLWDLARRLHPNDPAREVSLPAPVRRLRRHRGWLQKP